MGPSTVQINVDIAALICKELFHERWLETLSHVAQISKLWNGVAIPELYRKVVLDLHPQYLLWSKRILDTLRSNIRSSHAVKELVLLKGVWLPYNLDGYSIIPNEIVERISAILPLCPNLKHFEWDLFIPMPTKVIQTLTKLPCLKGMRVLIGTFGTGEEFECTQALRGNRKVTELQVYIGWSKAFGFQGPLPEDSPAECRRLSQALEFQSLIVKLPNLDALDLGSDVIYQIPPHSPFAFTSFPSVSKLTLRDWRFDIGGDRAIQNQLGFTALKHLIVSGGTGVEKLFISLRANDTQLETLHIDESGYGRLKGMPALSTFLISQHSLYDLALPDTVVPISKLLDCLRLNHQTLIRLKLGIQVPNYWRERSFISPTTIEAIHDACPNITDFEVYLSVQDLDVMTSRYPPTFKAFSKLARLAINSHYKEKIQKNPFESLSAIHSLAEAIRSPGMKLFELDVSDPSYSPDRANVDYSGREWRVKYNCLLPSPGFRVIDLAEEGFERWLKRLAKAQGQAYVPLNTREEKRKGYLEAMDWFKNNSHGYEETGSAQEEIKPQDEDTQTQDERTEN